MSRLGSDELLDRAMDACEADCNLGICRACGNEQDGCEPDARRYKCEACGEREVFGASELIVMYGG